MSEEADKKQESPDVVKPAASYRKKQLNRRKIHQSAVARVKNKSIGKPSKKLKDIEDPTFTEQLIRKDHTIVSLQEIKELTDKWLSTLHLDPINCLMHTLANSDENPVMGVHKMAFSLLRLLVMRAVSRMGNRAVVDVRGLPVYPLTARELAEFTKLAQTVLNSKNILINVRKQRQLEKEQFGEVVNLEAYSPEEIKNLAEKLRTDKKDEKEQK